MSKLENTDFKTLIILFRLVIPKETTNTIEEKTPSPYSYLGLNK